MSSTPIKPVWALADSEAEQAEPEQPSSASEATTATGRAVGRVVGVGGIAVRVVVGRGGVVAVRVVTASAPLSWLLVVTEKCIN